MSLHNGATFMSCSSYARLGFGTGFQAKPRGSGENFGLHLQYHLSKTAKHSRDEYIFGRKATNSSLSARVGSGSVGVEVERKANQVERIEF